MTVVAKLRSSKVIRWLNKGYSQKYEIDFEETFALVVHFSFIRTLLVFAVNNDMIVHQIDIVTALLMESYMERYTCVSHLGMKLLERRI